jgi:hypothetical protein
MHILLQNENSNTEQIKKYLRTVKIFTHTIQPEVRHYSRSTFKFKDFE